MPQCSSLINIVDGWFLRSTPLITKGKNPMPVFSSPLTFSLKPKSKVAIIGDSYKTDFLSILSNKFIAQPINSRSFPISLKDTNFKTQLLRFVNNGSWGHGAHDVSGGFTHLSSRYEFFKDLEIDELVKDFIADQSYNSNLKFNNEKVNNLIKMLNLIGLQGQFITTLSNGQFRRARIAKELYKDPSILCIDDPFLGLDPFAKNTVNEVLKKTSNNENLKTTIVIGLRIQDDIPDWIQDVVIVNKTGIVKQGKRLDLLNDIENLKNEFNERHQLLLNNIENNLNDQIKYFTKKNTGTDKIDDNTNDNIIEMKNTNISYKGIPIIKNLNWTVKNGEKWHIRGRNGSGKTTLLSLITLDHPQSWNKSIKIFGIERSPGKVNYFDTNKYIGFTSPELHALYPKNHTVFETISTGYIVGSFIPPRDSLTTEQNIKIENFLKILDLSYLKDVKFGDIPVSKQKLVLLLRSIINDPKILILDEALSAMDDTDLIKSKCLINQLNTTCLVISHVDDEVPKCDKYILVNDARHGKYEIGDVI
jgi:ABC-type molybdenum transport system ATPase subunit/photorepair protein PhrA